MAIPRLKENGELKEGEHEATLDEIETVYGQFSDRKSLMQGLRKAAENPEEAPINS